jgi:hypothetical protein
MQIGLRALKLVALQEDIASLWLARQLLGKVKDR